MKIQPEDTEGFTLVETLLSLIAVALVISVGALVLARTTAERSPSIAVSTTQQPAALNSNDAPGAVATAPANGSPSDSVSPTSPEVKSLKPYTDLVDNASIVSFFRQALQNKIAGECDGSGTLCEVIPFIDMNNDGIQDVIIDRAIVGNSHTHYAYAVLVGAGESSDTQLVDVAALPRIEFGPKTEYNGWMSVDASIEDESVSIKWAGDAQKNITYRWSRALNDFEPVNN